MHYHDKTLFINGRQVAEVPAGTYIGRGTGVGMSGAAIRQEKLGDVQHDILVVAGAPGVTADTVVPPGSIS